MEKDDLIEEVNPPVKTRRKMVEVVVARLSCDRDSTLEDVKKDKNLEPVEFADAVFCVELR